MVCMGMSCMGVVCVSGVYGCVWCVCGVLSGVCGGSLCMELHNNSALDISHSFVIVLKLQIPGDPNSPGSAQECISLG